MDQFNQLAARAKALSAALATRFAAIQQPAVKLTVAIACALLLLMLVWSVLPWIGFILAACIVAVVVRAFWPKDDG